jgi:hypothetical protein
MSQAAVSILRTTILNAVAANMLSNYECMFRKAGITEANSAFNMWSDARIGSIPCRRTNARRLSQLDAVHRDPRRWSSRGHSRIR